MHIGRLKTVRWRHSFVIPVLFGKKVFFFCIFVCYASCITLFLLCHPNFLNLSPCSTDFCTERAAVCNSYRSIFNFGDFKPNELWELMVEDDTYVDKIMFKLPKKLLIYIFVFYERRIGFFLILKDNRAFVSTINYIIN